ncbi:hypothetical protein [Mongoliibacter ruber]|nr:hypothetical protein [Mongoliibacter ruber]
MKNILIMLLPIAIGRSISKGAGNDRSIHKWFHLKSFVSTNDGFVG